MSSVPTSLVRYRPDLEQPAPDEAETIQSLCDSLRKIAQTTWDDTGHAWRSVHAKGHGLLTARVIVPDLPPELAQGMFAEPGEYDAVMRFSTNPGDVLDDTVSTPRGLALKILGVPGARLPGAEGESTQNFVMVNAPAFIAPDPQAFAKSLKMLAATTDTPQIWKKGFSAVMRGAEHVLEAVGKESGTLKSLGGHPMTHILGETFFTAVPLRFGDFVAKLSIAPVSPALVALKDQFLPLRGHPDGLRDAVSEFFAEQGGTWELRAQLCTDLTKMPIEDASVEWPEELSPYLTIATIQAWPQATWSPSRAKALDDGLFFSPWHGLAAHQPMGGIMRSRKPAYDMSAKFRGERNGCPMHEPTASPVQEGAAHPSSV